MDKKGFTLIELLAVIVLLGVVSLVIIPKIGDSISNSKNSAYEVQVNSIKKGVNDFVIANPSLISNDGVFSVKLGVVKQGGYLPVKIKNPITRVEFSNDSDIKIIKSGDEIEIELELKDIVDVDEEYNANSPLLVLNGNYIEYVDVNSNYTDLGVIAYTSDGKIIGNISKQIMVDDEAVSIVDTASLGTYNIVYQVTDDNGYSTSASRTVIVRDQTAPTLIVPSDTSLFVSEVSGFDLLEGVVATDNYDVDVNIDVDSSLSNVIGNYVINYTATDSSNNKTVLRRVINVVDDNMFYKYYAKTDYIKSNGNQYIDLGYKAKTNTEIKLDIEFIENENSYLESDTIYNTIIGVENLQGDRFNVNFGSMTEQFNVLYYWVDATYESGRPTYSQTYDDVLKRSVMTVKSGSATFLDITHEIEIKTADNISNMILLGSCSSVTKNVVSFNRYDTRVYGIKIYEGNTLIMDLIPCYNKNTLVYGLYDIVGDKFYGSSSGVDFIYD